MLASLWFTIKFNLSDILLTNLSNILNNVPVAIWFPNRNAEIKVLLDQQTFCDKFSKKDLWRKKTLKITFKKILNVSLLTIKFFFERWFN